MDSTAFHQLIAQVRGKGACTVGSPLRARIRRDPMKRSCYSAHSQLRSWLMSGSYVLVAALLLLVVAAGFASVGFVGYEVVPLVGSVI